MSNNPQSGDGNNGKGAPTNSKEFNAHFAAKTAEKMAKNTETLQRREETKQERLSRPWTPSEIKAFFDRKKEEAANRSPEQLEAARNGFFKRKAEQYNRMREDNFNELKAQPGYKDRSDEAVYKLAEMRIDLKRDLRKDGVEGAAFDKAIEKFDKHYSNPKNLDAVIEAAKEKSAEIVTQKAAEKSVPESVEAPSL